jgi:hypothetical protein
MLRFFAVSESPFAALPGFCVQKCNLLEARMIVTTSFENLSQAAVLSGSRLTRSPRRCNRFTKYRWSCSL